MSGLPESVRELLVLRALEPLAAGAERELAAHDSPALRAEARALERAAAAAHQALLAGPLEPPPPREERR
jgi:hypothetical protein